MARSGGVAGELLPPREYQGGKSVSLRQFASWYGALGRLPDKLVSQYSTTAESLWFEHSAGRWSTGPPDECRICDP